MSDLVNDVTCEHGTVLAAWCGQCALEWVPEIPQQPQPDRDQSAA